MAQFRKDLRQYMADNKTLFETNMIADKSGNVISNFLAADGPDKNAFGSIRTSATRLLGEFRNYYGTTGPLEILTKFEGSGSQTVNLAQTNTIINVTSTSGDRALRQTRLYHSYVPGTSQLGMVSFTMNAGKTNLQQMVGMFDDNNGIFLRYNGTAKEIVIRKGGIDSEVIAQANWNVDKLNGAGDSGIVLDLTKSQVLVIDYQWLGVGRVRVGFSINGSVYYAHHFNHANNSSGPYMYQPSLPVRWEIKNIGATDSSSNLMCVGYGVYSEGVENETGFDNAISNNTTAVVASTTGVDYGILAIRLKNTVNSQAVKAFARLKEWTIMTDETIRYRVLILPSIANISGTPTWNSVSPTSWCEYTTNFTLTGMGSASYVQLYDGYAVGGQANRLSPANAAIDNRSAIIAQNFDSTDSTIVAIVANKMVSNANIYSSMQWIEVK